MNNMIVNNMIETFNSYIIYVRAKHLIYMLEVIGLALMERVIVNRVMMENATNDAGPRMKKKLEVAHEAINCRHFPSCN